jgi:hypothetical protein
LINCHSKRGGLYPNLQVLEKGRAGEKRERERSSIEKDLSIILVSSGE